MDNEQEQTQEQLQQTTVDDFLKENVEQAKNVEVKLDRFKAPFVLRPLGAKEISDLRKQATYKTRNRRTGQMAKQTDNELLSDKMLVAAIVTPDLNNDKIQQSYGTIADPVGTIQAMLEAGEYADLIEKVQEVSGFDTMDEVTDEAKK